MVDTRWSDSRIWSSGVLPNDLAIGTLVPVDKAQAYYWYSIAAKPARSDVTIFNTVQVRFFAQQRAQALADSLSPAQRSAVGRQVAAWVPTSSTV